MFYFIALALMAMGCRGFGVEPEPSPITLMNPTVYYKPIVRWNAEQCPESQVVTMMSVEGKPLTKMCEVDFRRCLLEGACYVIEEAKPFRLFNYILRGANGEALFKEVVLRQCPYGYGSKNICLDPYFTVAADLKIYKLGEVIFVPRIQGQIMPDGQIHDGFFVVRDSGGAIKGPCRFDFYTGLTRPFDSESPFFKLGFANKKNALEFRRATEEEAQRTREKTKFPQVRHEILIPPVSFY